MKVFQPSVLLLTHYVGSVREEHQKIMLVLEEIINISKLFLMACYEAYRKLKECRAIRNPIVRSYISYSLNAQVPDQLVKIYRLVHGSDVHCLNCSTPLGSGDKSNLFIGKL
ncbi:hypothetical protein ABFS83_02G087500 [Erythranthe nasuta]